MGSLVSVWCGPRAVALRVPARVSPASS